jgi:hypothetical protein
MSRSTTTASSSRGSALRKDPFCWQGRSVIPLTVPRRQATGYVAALVDELAEKMLLMDSEDLGFLPVADQLLVSEHVLADGLLYLSLYLSIYLSC